MVVLAAHPGRSLFLRSRRRSRRRPTGRDQGAAPDPHDLCDHRPAHRTRLDLHLGQGHVEPRSICRQRTGARRHRGSRDRRHVHHGRPRIRSRHPSRRAPRADREIRCHPAELAFTTVRPLRWNLHRPGGRHRPASPTHEEIGMSVDTAPPATPEQSSRPWGARFLETVLTQRIALLGVLIVIVVGVLIYMSNAGYLTGDYDFDYMSATLIDAVPLALLGFAELIVIV